MTQSIEYMEAGQEQPGRIQMRVLDCGKCNSERLREQPGEELGEQLGLPTAATTGSRATGGGQPLRFFKEVFSA